MSRKTDFSLILRVSCPAVFCVVADTCEKPKLISSYVKNCTIHEQNSDSNKAKNCLENEWILGILVEQGKPATLASCKPRSNTFPLDNQRASA